MQLQKFKSVKSNNVSFAANYVTDINLLKKNKGGIYMPCNVSVVSIDPNNTQDISALDKVCKKWTGNIFCEDIKTCAESLHSGVNKNKIFVITAQKNDGSFEHCLDYNKILFLANINQKSSKTQIFHLESIPKKVSTEYKHAGTSFIEYLKTKTKKIELFCPDVSIIEQFYYQLGFKHKYPNSKLWREYGELYWIKGNSHIKDKISFWYKKLIRHCKININFTV